MAHTENSSERLYSALLHIHNTPPRLIVPPHQSNPPLTSLSSSFGHSHPTSPVTPSLSLKQPACSVAIILRIRPDQQLQESFVSATSSPRASSPSASSSGQLPGALHSTSPITPQTLPVTAQITSFFSQQWVRSGTPEVLFIKRATRPRDRWSAHIAFPGGRQDPDDEGPSFTALRETWEEVGIDLCEKDYLSVGQLDDREITSSLGKKLLMILSPFVYLYTGKETPIPELQAQEVASAHWVPLSHLQIPDVRWGTVSVDLGSRLSPRNAIVRNTLRFLIGQMHFRCILLPNEPVAVSDEELLRDLASLPDLRLWGLTLGLCLDLISHMSVDSNNSSLPAINPSPATYPFLEPRLSSAGNTPFSSQPISRSSSRGHSRQNTGISFIDPPNTATSKAPSLASVMPTFEGADLNLWLWIFSWRYRRLLGNWDAANVQDRRVNWAGMALASFYAALRRALVVAIVIRALVVVGGVSTAIAWLVRKYRERSMQRRLSLWIFASMSL